MCHKILPPLWFSPDKKATRRRSSIKENIFPFLYLCNPVLIRIRLRLEIGDKLNLKIAFWETFISPPRSWGNHFLWVRGGAFVHFHATKTLLWIQATFIDILMKCCMVACINILFWRNRSAAMYDVITEVQVVKIFCEKKKLQIDSKWSETRKKHETADPSAAATADRHRPILPVEYVNTSYHTTFHQNISINVACVQKRALVAWNL